MIISEREKLSLGEGKKGEKTVFYFFFDLK
jgi:hypothetical protein